MKKLEMIIPALAALFWGSVIVFLYVTGRMGEFLVPKFHIVTMIGGLGMIVMGLFVLLTSKESADCGHDHCDHEHEHHEQSPWAVFLLMILPLSAAMATDTSQGYSMSILERKGLYNGRANASAYVIPPYTKEMLEESTPKNDQGHYQLPLSQLYFSALDDSMMEVFDRLPFETEGQLVEEKINNEDGTRLRLYRTLMTCCAADAMVLGFPLEFGKEPPLFEDRAWVRVGGTLSYETLPDGSSTVFNVENIEIISPPTAGGFGIW